jgi:hypothetical protein
MNTLSDDVTMATTRELLDRLMIETHRAKLIAELKKRAKSAGFSTFGSYFQYLTENKPTESHKLFETTQAEPPLPLLTKVCGKLYDDFVDEPEVFNGTWRDDAQVPKRLLNFLYRTKAIHCPSEKCGILSGILTDAIQIYESRGWDTSEMDTCLKDVIAHKK